MDRLLFSVIYTFCVALGIMLGGSLFGALGSLFFSRPPLFSMVQIADKLKVWATFAALGDTFSTVRKIEEGFLGGHPENVAKQLLIIFGGLVGAHIGYMLIVYLAGGD